MISYVSFGGLLTLVVILAIQIRKRLLLKWHVQSLGIPELKGNPLVGNLLHVMKLFGRAPGVPFTVYTLEALNGFGKIFEKEDLFILCPEPTRANVFVCKAETVEVILASNQILNKSTDYEVMKCLLGDGLITSSNPKWRKQRKMLTPAFHFRILNHFQPIMFAHSQFLIERLKGEVVHAYTDIEPYLTACTLDIISETSLGLNAQEQSIEKSAYSKALNCVNKLLVKRALSPWLLPDVLFRLSPTGREFKKQKEIIDSFICKVIEQKKQEFSSYSKDQLCSEDFQERMCKSFLDLLIMTNLSTENKFTYQDIEDEVQTFSFAGHETTTVTLCWTLYLLGLHPEVQTKIHNELLDVLGEDKDKLITQNDIKQLAYLECVIKESQRLFPAVPFIGRHAFEDFNINGKLIPKGTNIGIPINIVHHDKRFFPNPELFDPDRFLDTRRHPFAYIPFAAGPRNCIGQRFALVEMKTVLANLLRNFLFTSLDPRDVVLPSFEAVVRPSQPLRIHLQMI